MLLDQHAIFRAWAELEVVPLRLAVTVDLAAVGVVLGVVNGL